MPRLRKNAACHFAERGLNDGGIGMLCDMTAETVRRHTKRAISLIIAKSVAQEISRGTFYPLNGEGIQNERKIPCNIKMVPPTGIFCQSVCTAAFFYILIMHDILFEMCDKDVIHLRRSQTILKLSISILKKERHTASL
jgi:hypothetical protein